MLSPPDGKVGKRPGWRMQLNWFLAPMRYPEGSPRQIAHSAASLDPNARGRNSRMNALENRLTLHRRHCEERQRYLAELESLAQRLRADGGRLRSEIELAVTVGNPASTQPLLERHGKLARSLAAIEGQVAAAASALATAVRELKRHELAAAQRVDDAATPDGRRAPGSSRARPAIPGRGG